MGEAVIRFIRKDGTVIRHDDSLFLELNENTEHIYEFIMNHKIVKEKTEEQTECGSSETI